MERKLGLGLVALLGGLVCSCVSPAEVDEEGPKNDGEQAASTSSNNGGSGEASALDGAGGTQSTGTTTVNGVVGNSGTGGGGVSSAGSGGSSSGQQTTGGAGGQPTDDICPFDGELEYDPDGPYPFCEGTESFSLGGGDPLPSENEPIQNRCREQIPGSLVGLGRSAWSSADGSPDAEPLNFCVCNDECESDSECPVGDTGTATPSCVPQESQKMCFLTCDNGETCPDGMTCTQGHGFERRVCAWGTRNAGCDTSEWPNVTNPAP